MRRRRGDDGEQAHAEDSGERHPDVVPTIGALGRAAFYRGDAAQAQRLFERALAHDEALHGPDHVSVAYDLMDLAWTVATAALTGVMLYFAFLALP